MTAHEPRAPTPRFARRLRRVDARAASRARPRDAAPPQEAQLRPQQGTDAGVDAALTTLRALGYRLSTPAREALTHPEQAWALVNAAARLSSGSPSAEYRPFYPDFPIQVRTASEATLLVNAALHYLGDVVGVRILPDYRPSPREPLPGDDATLTGHGTARARAPRPPAPPRGLPGSSTGY